MTYAQLNAARSLYRETHVRGSVDSADRHQLTGMLLDTLIERMNQARGHIQHGNVTGKGETVSKAVAILGELRQSLDHAVDGSLSGRLDSLYDYVTRRLLQAQLDNDANALGECVDLITPIRDAWQGIRDAYLAAEPMPA